jgi:hypothetical protein
MDDVLAGRALSTDIDEYISRWHSAPERSPAAAMELHEFLGMTWDEYRIWAEHPESLRFILAARRSGQPVAEVLATAQSVGAAARSAEAGQARCVLNWLIARGRIKAAPGRG